MHLINKKVLTVLFLIFFSLTTITLKAQCGFTVNYSYFYGACDTVDHSVILFVSGGTPPYVYWWENLYTTPYNFLDTGYHWVCITDNSGCTECDTFSLNCGTWWGTSIDEVGITPFELTPNPFSDKINITSKDGGIGSCRFSIYDCFGRFILSKTIFSKSDENVDLSSFDSGIYFCRIEYGDKIYSAKIIKS